MAFAKIYSAQAMLPEARLVSVEIDVSLGLHSFSIVGLPDKGIEESKDRAAAAIKNSGFKSPKQTNNRITISLAPADMRKEGPVFDLPIALAYLLAQGHAAFEPEGKLFAGELALDGTIRPIRGALSLAKLARKMGMEQLYVPEENAAEAALIDGLSVFGARSLREVVMHLSGEAPMSPAPPMRLPDRAIGRPSYAPDWSDIKGHAAAKRGLMIALAGGHNVALFGPPGTGKTMLARASRSILPPLSFKEMLEALEIRSAYGPGREGLASEAPFRSPHHTSSYSAIIGGGSPPRPGEVTLAHRGILFLDEFPEFDGRVTEALRQPLEERTISISRAGGTAIFPASFILIAACNPCPCGNKGIEGKWCACSAKDLQRYRRKLSGPIADRIDMWIEMSRVEHASLTSAGDRTEIEYASEAIAHARASQKERFEELGIEVCLNAHIPPQDMHRATDLDTESEETLRAAATAYGISGRRYHRIIKLARTIADMAGSGTIRPDHILEALQYRQKDQT